MKFEKGNKAAANRKKKEGSPVTLSNLKKHYQDLDRLLPNLDDADRAKVLMKLIEWEHAEIFGKPTEKVELSGSVETRAVLEIGFTDGKPSKA